VPPEEEEEDVQATGRIGYVPPGTLVVQTQGFVTRRELLEAGEIVGSSEEKQLLSFNDSVYMSFEHAKPRPGDEMVVFSNGQGGLPSAIRRPHRLPHPAAWDRASDRERSPDGHGPDR